MSKYFINIDESIAEQVDLAYYQGNQAFFEGKECPRRQIISTTYDDAYIVGWKTGEGGRRILWT